VNCLCTMDVKRIILPCLFLAGIWQRSFSQAIEIKGPGNNQPGNAGYSKTVYDTTDDHFILYMPKQGACKSVYWEPVFSMGRQKQEVIPVKEVIHSTPVVQSVPFMQLHGNIAYTFDYRSQLDTPFAASNLQQHNEQVYADATLKGRYPFRIVVNSRQSNSSFFSNYTDLNIEFNHPAFQRNIKEAMIKDMTGKMKAMDSTDKYEARLNDQKNEYFIVKNWLANPARTQEIVQEKERTYQQVLLLNAKESGLNASADTGRASPSRSTDQFPAWGQPTAVRNRLNDLRPPVSKDALLSEIGREKDSLLSTMRQPTETEKKMREKDRWADSAYKRIRAGQRKADSLAEVGNSRIKEYAGKIRNARSVGELEDLEKKYGTSSMSRSDKTLLAVTHFGIGRSAMNYSDLTVNNISLNGLNVEYNPSYYAAFAVGSVDYLFRDFIVKPGGLPKQNLILGRIGWGDKEKKIFILTAYEGTKNSFGGATTGTFPSNPPVNSMHIFGYSLEAKYKLDQNMDLSFEAAKSSAPYAPGLGKSGSFQHAFAFSDHNNEALSAKFNMAIPITHSTINLFYKNIGANFQSYSVFNSGTRQEGWGAKWRQYLFRDQLSVTLEIKKSYFDDPLITPGYGSSMIFKSGQLVYRRKKWPVLMAGYMPSTQLTKSPNGYLSENIYYALTAGMFYNYSLLKLRMNSSLMFSRFYNRGTDTGFIHYNARNILFTHNIELRKIHVWSTVQYTRQPDLLLWTFEQGADLEIGNYLTVGSSLKNDLLPQQCNNYWGGSLHANIRFKDIGALRIQYARDYLPNSSGGIIPDNWGKAIWVKVF
jgi:hypothetical protein